MAKKKKRLSGMSPKRGLKVLVGMGAGLLTSQGIGALNKSETFKGKPADATTGKVSLNTARLGADGAIILAAAAANMFIDNEWVEAASIGAASAAGASLTNEIMDTMSANSTATKEKPARIGTDGNVLAPLAGMGKVGNVDDKYKFLIPTAKIAGVEDTNNISLSGTEDVNNIELSGPSNTLDIS